MSKFPLTGILSEDSGIRFHEQNCPIDLYALIELDGAWYMSLDTANPLAIPLFAIRRKSNSITYILTDGNNYAMANIDSDNNSITLREHMSIIYNKPSVKALIARYIREKL